MCAWSHVSLERVPQFSGITVGPKTLEGHPRSQLGETLRVGQCIYLNSCVREGRLTAPFLQPPVPGSQRHWTSICFLPLPSAWLGWPRHAAHCDSLPLTCCLPHARLLCHQFGSVRPSPAAHSLAFLAGVLGNRWHQRPGSEPSAGCWSLRPEGKGGWDRISPPAHPSRPTGWRNH